MVPGSPSRQAQKTRTKPAPHLMRLHYRIVKMRNRSKPVTVRALFGIAQHGQPIGGKDMSAVAVEAVVFAVARHHMPTVQPCVTYSSPSDIAQPGQSKYMTRWKLPMRQTTLPAKLKNKKDRGAGNPRQSQSEAAKL